MAADAVARALEGDEAVGRRIARAGGRVILPLLAIALLVGLWWLATIAFGWKPFLVPSPKDVWNELVRQRHLLPGHVEATVVETLEGFGLAIVIAVPVAVAIAYSRVLEASIYPALVALNAIPKIAIAPLLVIWMGFGAGPKIAMVVLICFFPIVISTATGLKATPAEFVELSRSLASSPRQEFAKFRFPASLPYVFVGLKVAITLAVIGAVVGEFVGATEGLGYVIVASGQNANTSLAFAAIALLSLLSIALFYAVVLIERLMIPWAADEQQP